jgi:hypothetical protein
VKLLRLASIDLLRAPPTQLGRNTYTAQNGIEVSTDHMDGVEACLLPGMRPQVAPAGHPQFVFPTQRSKVRMGVSTLVDCSPADVRDGAARIPRALLAPLEQAIGEYADVLGVTYQCRRIIRSPEPCVAIAAGPGEEALFQRITHLEPERADVGGALVMPPRLPNDLQSLVADRMDGLALLADSLGEDSAIGRIRDLFRLFERAFRSGPTACIGPLAQFLGSHPRNDALQYSQAEVAHWFDVLRATSMHADRRPTYARSADVAPHLGRVEVAAYDVLFNKELWRDATASRRSALDIASGVQTNGTTVVLGPGASVQIPWMDPWSGYPIDHGARVALTPGWVWRSNPDD